MKKICILLKVYGKLYKLTITYPTFRTNFLPYSSACIKLFSSFFARLEYDGVHEVQSSNKARKGKKDRERERTTHFSLHRVFCT